MSENLAHAPDLQYILNMEKTIYLDSTIFSFYYDERPDFAYHRTTTVKWWTEQRMFYNLYTSLFVLREVEQPIYPNWEKVTALAQGLPLLEFEPEIKGIIKVYLENRIMPKDDAGDAAHLAIASYYGLDYLLTWNCKHLANANKFEAIRHINLKIGLLTPAIVTPDLLFVEEE